MTQIKPSCTIEFRVHDPERYSLLERFFQALREYTKSIDRPKPEIQDDVTAVGRGTLLASADDETNLEETIAKKQFSRPEEWLLTLRPQDLEQLNMPNHRESILAIRDWQGLSRRERRKLIKAQENAKVLRNLADFTDMLRYWQDVEYELVALEQTDPDKARIRYTAFDFPFKGKVALEELLMFFGFLSILKDSC
ncbi:MAG: hypothetical protein Phog2KO_10210 [Phototrophicaceae bacterium]